jgi:hypothetical protein
MNSGDKKPSIVVPVAGDLMLKYRIACIDSYHLFGFVIFIKYEGGFIMANCADMKKGDLYVCKTCGLELQVSKACSCGSSSGAACTAPLQCCGTDMVKK